MFLYNSVKKPFYNSVKTNTVVEREIYMRSNLTPSYIVFMSQSCREKIMGPAFIYTT